MNRPPDDLALDHAVSVLRMLADRTRLSILDLIHHEELPVTAIAQALDRPGPAVSQHLAKLRAAHLVTTRREGTTIYYAQSDPHLAALVTNSLQLSEHALYEYPPHHETPASDLSIEAPDLP